MDLLVELKGKHIIRVSIFISHLDFYDISIRKRVTICVKNIITKNSYNVIRYYIILLGRS